MESFKVFRPGEVPVFMIFCAKNNGWNKTATKTLSSLGAGCCEHYLRAEVARSEIPQWGIGALANLRLASFPETNCQKPLKIGWAPKGNYK